MNDFTIYPAIDLRNGNCVRLLQGDFAQETVFGSNPVEMAVQWQSQGAKWLHMVDLDGAKNGSPCQLNIIEAVSKAVNIPIQLGGGIRSLESAKAALDAGASRIIIGSAAVRNPEFAEKAFAAFGDKVALGVDGRHRMVAIDGWQSQTEIPAIELIKQMAEIGASRVIYTEISRDGMLNGFDEELYTWLCSESPIPIIASGGFATQNDVAVAKRSGAEGAIVGKALYTGAVKLQDILKLAE